MPRYMPRRMGGPTMGPTRSTGSANADLSQFSGTHSGYGNFQFGELMKQRQDLQKRMMEEQLRNMTEERLARRKSGMTPGQTYDDRKNTKGRKWQRISMPGRGQGSPHALPGDNYEIWIDKETGQTFNTLTGQMGGPGTPSGSASMSPGDLSRGPGLAEQLQQLRALDTATGGGTGGGAGGGGEDGGGAAVDPNSINQKARDKAAERIPTEVDFEPMPGFEGPMDLVGSDPLLDARMDQHTAGLDAQIPMPGDPIDPNLTAGGGGWGMPLKSSLPAGAVLGGLKKGGYIPKTGKYELHKGEVVLSKEQAKQKYPGLGPGPQRKGYQTGSMSPETLAAWERYRMAAESMGRNTGMPAPLGPGGAGTTPNLGAFPPGYANDVGRGALGPGRQGLLGPGGGPMARSGYGSPGMRHVGSGATDDVGKMFRMGQAAKAAGRGSEVQAIARALRGKGKLGMAAAAALIGGAALASLSKRTQEDEKRGERVRRGARKPVEGLPELGEDTASFLKDFEAPSKWDKYEGGPTSVAYDPESTPDMGPEYEGVHEMAGLGPALGKFLGSGEAATPMPEGQGSGIVSQTGGGPPDTSGIQRIEGDIPLMYAKGTKESSSEKFQKYVDDLKRQSDRAKSFADVAYASASNMEIQMNKRPNADNKGLEKMMKARTKEGDRHTKNYEKKKEEYLSIKSQQQALDTELQKTTGITRQKNLDNAFDSIDSMWNAAIKMDDGQEKWAQQGVNMLLPYMSQLQQMYGDPDFETTKARMYQLFDDAFEDPSQIKMLKLHLMGT